IVAQLRPLQAGPGDPGRVLGLGTGLRGAQQRLGRDARPVGALTADALPLDDRDPQAAAQQPVGGGLPAGAHAEHDHVVMIRHVISLPSPVCGPAQGRPRPRFRRGGMVALPRSLSPDPGGKVVKLDTNESRPLLFVVLCCLSLWWLLVLAVAGSWAAGQPAQQ